MQRMRSRTLRRIMIGAVTLTGITFGGSCGSDSFSLTTFRDAAASDVTDGLALLMQGFVSGVFAGLAGSPADSTTPQ